MKKSGVTSIRGYTDFTFIFNHFDKHVRQLSVYGLVQSKASASAVVQTATVLLYFVRKGSIMLKCVGRVPIINPETVISLQYYTFDPNLFSDPPIFQGQKA